MTRLVFCLLPLCLLPLHAQDTGDDHDMEYWFGARQSGFFTSLVERIGYVDATFDQVTLDDCKCPSFTKAYGSTLAVEFGMGYSAALSRETHIDLTLYPGVTYQEVTSKAPGEDLPSLDSVGGVVYSSTEHQLDVSFPALSGMIAGAIEVHGVRLEVGVGSYFRLGGSYLQTLNIIEPANAVYDSTLFPPEDYINNGQTIVMDRDIETNVVESLIFYHVGLGYEKWIDDMLVGMGVNARYSPTGYLKNSPGNVLSYLVEFRMGYAL